MRIVGKVIITAAILVLIVVIGSMIYLVRAKFTLNDYNTQVSLAFNAAMMVNAQETYTDADRAVIAETENGRFVIAPENYRTLTFYLKVQAAMPLFERIDADAPLKISICNESMVYMEPDADGDGANIRYISGDEKFTMHVSDPDLWDELIHTCEYGTSRAENIPVE